MDDRFLEVDETRICYAEAGTGAPLVCIHGNLGSHRWFERVMVMSGLRTIALDLPNFGASGPLPGAITIDAYADAAAAFMLKLGLDAAHVVGHSLGGLVAIGLAVRHPGLLRSLVLVDSAAPSGLVTPTGQHPLIEMMRGSRAVLTQALRGVVPTLKDEAFFLQLVEDAARMAAPAWIGNAVALGQCDYGARCAGFTAPVLVLWGRRDVIVTEAMARETAGAFPKARLEILENVGHSLPVEDPALFMSLVEEFIGTRRSGA